MWFRKWFVWILALLAVCGIPAIELMTPFEDDYWSVIFEFAGSLHPIVLHLPIGLWFGVLALLVAATVSQGAVPPALLRGASLLTFVTTIAAFAAGVMLYLGGGYGRDSVELHMYSSLAFLLSSGVFTLWAMHCKNTRYLWPCALFTTVILFFAGHAGGLITHGDPLEKAPWRVFAARELAVEPSKSREGDERVFHDLVLPILEEKCLDCHGAERAKGKLQMHRYATLLKGGSKGPSVVPGNLAESLIITRLHLPLEHKERMPPADRPQLSDAELGFLNWWVGAGPDEMTRVADADLPEEYEVFALSRIGNSPEAIQAREAKARTRALFAAYAAIKQQFPGVLVQSVVGEPLFELSSASILGYDEQVLRTSLEPLMGSLVRIDWNRRALDAQWLALFAKADRLEVLNLADSEFSQDGLSQLLTRLGNLKKINLTGTAFADKHIDTLLSVTTLEALVTTDSQLSESGYRRLLAEFPDIQVISDFAF